MSTTNWQGEGIPAVGPKHCRPGGGLSNGMAGTLKSNNIVNPILNIKTIQTIMLSAAEVLSNGDSKSEGRAQMTRNMGSWSAEEQQKYVEFLSSYRKILQSRQQRKNIKIFKLMADFVGSRDGIQCRSHHIKQMRTHRQIKRIIDFNMRGKCEGSQQRQGLEDGVKQFIQQRDIFIIPRLQNWQQNEQGDAQNNPPGIFYNVVPFYQQNFNFCQLFSQIPEHYLLWSPFVLLPATLPLPPFSCTQ